MLNNYTITSNTANFTITPAPQTITLTPFGAGTSTSGGAVTFSASSPGCSVTSGGAITFIVNTPGTICTVTANQAGDSNYQAASRNFTITLQ